MRKAVAVLATAAVLLGSRAQAAATFEYLFDNGYPISVSSDGSVVVGNGATGQYIPFRWSQATGFVSLGRPQNGGAGGQPGVSADGRRVASSIGSLDNTYTTQGLWTLGSGWQELMPPTPADGGSVDGSYGNVWALSGNGQVVVGLYWRPGPGNHAHASKWTQATGVVDLGGTTTGQSSRANCVNHDGSVIAGWVETPTGPWRPAAWVDGSLVLLTRFSATTVLVGAGEARATNFTGDIIVGFASDSASQQRAAVMWKRTNGVWGPTQVLGWVDGSEPQNGLNIASAVSYDGSIAVGYCSFDGTPFATTGLVWTAATGVIDVNEFLADNGVLVDPNFTIQSMTAMTPDGRQLFGYGQMLVPPYTGRAFRITLPSTLDAPRPVAAAGLELAAPRPNPSAAVTRLDFTLPSASSAELSVFDAAGRRVATLVQGDLPAGRHSASWDGHAAGGGQVAAGLYFARLATQQGTVSRRIVRSN
jgi:uncharacterized membrane protein